MCELNQNKKLKKAEGRRNNLYYGYCMFLTNAATDVHAHLSGREISTGLFLPVTKFGNTTGELPRTLTVSQTSKKRLHAQSSNVKSISTNFREAVQFSL